MKEEKEPSTFKKEVRLNLSERDLRVIEDAFFLDLKDNEKRKIQPRLEMIWKHLVSEFNRKEDYGKREYLP